MNKMLKLITSLVLLLPFILAPSNQYPVFVQADENVDFYMDTPQVADQQVTGKALANQPITLSIDERDYEGFVESDSAFTFEDIPSLEEDMELRLSQGTNEVTSTVYKQGEGPDKAELNQPFNFEGLVLEETEETHEDSGQFNEDQIESEQNLDEASESELDQAEQVEESSESEVADDEADHETEVSDESESDLNQSRITTFQAQQLSPSQAPGPTSANVQVAEVSTIQELRNAMANDQIEIVRLTQDIITSTGATTNMDVSSTTRRKILDGNGYRLEIDEVANFDTLTRIDDMVVRNFSNIFVQNYSYGFLRMRTNAYDLHYENIHFNRDQLVSGGHLGSAWESAMHFYGDISVYTPPATNFISQYRLARIHDGANIVVEAGQNAFDHRNTGGVAGLDRGLIVGNNVALDVIAGNNAVDSGFSGNGNVHLTVGTNSTVNLHSRNANAFYADGTSSVDISVGEGSTLNLDANNYGISASNNNTGHTVNIDVYGNLNITSPSGIHFRRQSFNFNLHPQSRTQIDAVANGFYQQTGSNSNRPRFSVAEEAQWFINSQQAAFSLITSSIFDIRGPELVDWQVSPGASHIISNNVAHDFTIADLQMLTWHNQPSQAEADVETEYFNSGTFTLSNNGFNNVTTNPASDVFPSQFNRTMKRWQFRSVIESPEVDGPITDTVVEITGSGPLNSSIDMMDDSGNIIATSQVDASGNFTFTLDQPFEVGSQLHFRARRNNLQSDAVSEVVVGNRLELRQVSDMIFQTTEIRDEPDLLINKEEAVTAEVYDTRENGSWQLTVRANGPLTNSEGHALDNALFFSDGSNMQSFEDQAVLVATSEDENLTGENYTHQLSWEVDQGFLMQVNPIYARTGSTYQTSVEWTLTDAP